MPRFNKKGQGSFLSGDVPSIIMIMVSITFFISSIFMALNQFNSTQDKIDMEAALVDAASTFLKENARVNPNQLTDSGFWSEMKKKIESTYQVNVYIEVVSLDPSAGVCMGSPADCYVGVNPESLDNEPSELLSKKFPVALDASQTDLEVYPALAKVEVYKSL